MLRRDHAELALPLHGIFLLLQQFSHYVQLQTEEKKMIDRLCHNWRLQTNDYSCTTRTRYRFLMTS